MYLTSRLVIFHKSHNTTLALPSYAIFPAEDRKRAAQISKMSESSEGCSEYERTPHGTIVIRLTNLKDQCKAPKGQQLT